MWETAGGYKDIAPVRPFPSFILDKIPSLVRTGLPLDLIPGSSAKPNSVAADSLHIRTMPTLVGKEIGPTGYGTMRTFFCFVNGSSRQPTLLTIDLRHDLERPATRAGGVL